MYLFHFVGENHANLLMADQMMPDGERRGGFARLATVVKASAPRAAT
jgi:hypothetical protein